MNPTLDEVRKIAQTGLYKRIPVCRELYADRYKNDNDSGNSDIYYISCVQPVW